jgi:hypothetical protein
LVEVSRGLTAVFLVHALHFRLLCCAVAVTAVIISGVAAGQQLDEA